MECLNTRFSLKDHKLDYILNNIIKIAFNTSVCLKYMKYMLLYCYF